MTSETTSVDVRQFIDQRPLGAFHWLLLALCVVAALMDGFDTASMGYVAPALVDAWQLQRSALGPVMSAALVGMAAGGLLGGPLGDRFGRKGVMIGSALLFGALTLVSALASSAEQLALLRLCAGLGFGAMLPNATALLGEYAPLRRRTLLVSMLFCGLTLGYSLSGFVAAAIIPRYGWQAMFVVGGAAPLLFALVLPWLLPESARFLVVAGKPQARIAATLARLAPGERARLQAASGFTLPSLTTTRAGQPVRTILRPPMLAGTLLLWLVYFCGLVAVFLMGSWLPTLLKDSGYSMSAAANIAALYQLGGTVGALLMAWLMGRIGAYRTIALAYALGAVAILALSQSLGRGSTAVGLLVLAAGFFSNGAQTPMSAVATAFYPTAARSTGVGWMLGMGRFGAVLGSYIGAPLLAMGFGFAGIVGGLAIPLGMAAGGIFAMGLAYGSSVTRQTPAPAA
jgi:AAHS family 4-hydroxybenzoate transporter-like MFS transporter